MPDRRKLAGMTDVPNAIEAVWTIEPARLIAAIYRVTHDSTELSALLCLYILESACKFVRSVSPQKRKSPD